MIPTKWEGVTVVSDVAPAAVWGTIIAVILLGFGLGWFVLSLFGMIGRGIGALLGVDRPASLAPPVVNGVRCAHPTCQAPNPDHARFCRRCGKMIASGGRHGRPAVRRVAMW